ncbi:MAG: hypothetical protein ABSG37_08260 [Candidatus Limnocylindrales bacterium]|jgi:transcriptional regulator with XRE-family HTH domain
MPPNDDEFRAALRDILARSDMSMRALSAAMGRDPGYVAALLDPSRPSRARPTPADLLAASDATGISFVELLESLWGIPLSRLADELARLGAGPSRQGEAGRRARPGSTASASRAGRLRDFFDPADAPDGTVSLRTSKRGIVEGSE